MADQRSRSASFRRQTQRRLSMQRRRSVNLGSNSPDARVQQMADQMTKVRLSSLADRPALLPHLPQELGPVQATVMAIGQSEFVRMGNERNRKLYARIDQEEQQHAGELLKAAEQRAKDGPEDTHPPQEILLQGISDAPTRDRRIAEIREVYGPDIPIRLVSEVNPSSTPPPPPPSPREGPARPQVTQTFQRTAPPPPPAGPGLRRQIGVPGVPTRVPSVMQVSNDLGKPTEKDGVKRQQLLKKLGDFHASLSAYRDAMNGLQGREILPRDLEEKFQAYRRLLVLAKVELEQAVQTYEEESRSLGVSKAKSEKLLKIISPRFENAKLRVVRNLGAEVRNFDIDEATQAARNQLNMVKFQPLLESDIARDQPAVILGIGTNGPVRAFVFQTVGRDDLPPTFLAGRKMNEGEATDPASNAGVPRNNPEQAQRGVATFMMSRVMKMTNVPITVFFAQKNDRGEFELGQAIEVVNGTDGQIELAVSPEEAMRNSRETQVAIEQEIRRLDIPPAEQEAFRQQAMESTIAAFERQMAAISDDLNSPAPNFDAESLRNKRLKIRVLPGGRKEVFPFVVKPVDLAYRTDGGLQKGLADLQVLDVIIGHPDRNGGNYKFVLSRDQPYRIIGVMALDNDDAFGHLWKARSLQNRPGESVTPGLPPLVDFHTALGVLETRLADLRPVMDLLSPNDQTALRSRLLETQDELTVQLLSGKFASEAPLTQADIDRLSGILGLPSNQVQALVGEGRLWGKNTFEDHVVRSQDGSIHQDSMANSYLGQISYRAQPSQGGTTPPQFKTVPN
ncbi:MAG: hypothetical protein AAFR61_25215 [Bacteroidota bacterium]